MLSRCTVVRGTPPIRTTIKQIFTEHAGRNFGRAHVLRALSAALIGLVARELADGSLGSGAADSDLFRRFGTLLEQHHLQRWSVSDYAQALSITPTHLNRVTRASTGDTASHLILNRLIREARRNLVYTNLPISTIAYALGFLMTRPISATGSMRPRPACRRAPFSAQVHGEDAFEALR